MLSLFVPPFFCLLLLQQMLAGINVSREAAWIIHFVLSADFSPELWAQIKLPPCLCARIRRRRPWSIKINRRIPFCRGKLLRYVLIRLMSLKDPPPCLKPATPCKFTDECNTAPHLLVGSWLAHQYEGLARGRDNELLSVWLFFAWCQWNQRWGSVFSFRMDAHN